MKLKLALLVLLALVPLSQRRVDARLGEHRGAEDALYVWSGQHVKRLSPGFENLMADLYWLRTVQYFGAQRVFASEKRFDLLYPLTQITVTLDPRFEIAYQYGAVFLSEPWPQGAGQPEKGVQLLRQGADALKSWRLRKDEGYFTFVFLGDHRKSAEILLEASQMPGAAYWLKTLAADTLARGGDRDVSRRIWRNIRDDSQGPMRVNAEFNLSRLDALDVQDALQAAVREFERARGRRPGALVELPEVASGRLPMSDPSGSPFDYNRESGTVSISKSSTLWRTPREHL